MATTAVTNMRKEADEIRKAWQAGRKQVTLNGKVFNIRKRTRKDVVFQTGLGTTISPHVQHKVTEDWLIAEPVDGKVPVYNVELKHLGNLRSAKSA